MPSAQALLLHAIALVLHIDATPEELPKQNEYMQYVNDVHWYGMRKLKSLYYFRSNAARTVENVNVKVPRINLEDTECIACEG